MYKTDVIIEFIKKITKIKYYVEYLEWKLIKINMLNLKVIWKI